MEALRLGLGLKLTYFTKRNHVTIGEHINYTVSKVKIVLS